MIPNLFTDKDPYSVPYVYSDFVKQYSVSFFHEKFFASILGRFLDGRRYGPCLTRYFTCCVTI